MVKKYGLGVIPYFALAAGFFTGKTERVGAAQAARAGMVEKYRNERGYAVVDALVEIAQTQHHTGNCSTGLAAGAAWRHRAHRQRHQ